jgi:2-methylisocitrate lyase-like PEP mutase family enzyme
VADLAALGVARVSWALFLFRQTMGYFEEQLASLRD